MGGSKHLRSYEVPTFWPISLKERHWAIKPGPGPHPIERAIPLGMLIRDVMKLASTGREVRKVLSKGLVKVDGRIRRDYRFPIGIMDVIEIVPAKKYYRIVPDEKDFMKPIEIEGGESKVKPLRIENKTTIRGGVIQLNLFDGSNILVPKESQLPFTGQISTFSTILVKVPEMEIIDYLPLAEGAYVVVMGGKNVGTRGRIAEIRKGARKSSSLVTIKKDDSSLVQTSLNYVYVVGKDTPVIKL
jgi:small subunit ribosomal protein S4e